MPKVDPSTPSHWRQQTYDYLRQHVDHPPRIRSLASAIGIDEGEYRPYRDWVRDEIDAGRIVVGKGRGLRLSADSNLVVGIFKGNDRGFGFVESPGRDSLFITRHHVNGALHGDRVQARLLRSSRLRRDHERLPGDHLHRGEIVEILERESLEWIGVVDRVSNVWVVKAQNKPGAPLLRIDDPSAKDCRLGDLVVAEPLPGTLRERVARGVIVERLGAPTITQNLITAAIRRHAIPDTFPLAAREEAQTAAQRLDEIDLSSRRDLRELLTITIDPPDARDFDDAITIENLPKGRMRLGVHIADVAFFVPAGSALDAEAIERGVSVYFPRFVVPMLPEVLSNGACSLQPEVDRLTKTAFITYSRDGEVEEIEIVNSVIRSNQRLTYIEASDALRGKPADLAGDVVELLEDAERLATVIQDRRRAAGMIELALPEVAVELDDAGRIVDAAAAEQSFSHKIIEMFMVEANEAVCRWLTARGLPHLRRVHPPPDPDAVRNLRPLGPLIGDPPQQLDRDAILTVQQRVQDDAGAASAVHYVLLRSMSQACYSPAQEGHFALASEAYCHFTSPIRRYADLTIHRAIDAALDPTEPPPRKKRSRRQREAAAESGVLTDEDLTLLAADINQAERRAMQAERDVTKALLVQLMADKEGETLEGVITGVTSGGVFVQLEPYLADGRLATSEFGPGAWEHRPKSGAFVDLNRQRVVHVGQRVRVIVAATDVVRQEIDLALAPGEQLGDRRVALREEKPTKPKRVGARKRTPKGGSKGRGGRSAGAKRKRR